MKTAWIALIFLALGTTAGCRQDPCESVACQNGGTCMDGDCNCPEGFTGERCETFDGLQFIGTYDAVYGPCFDVPDDHRVVIEPVEGQANRLNLYNLGDYACPGGDLRLQAEIDANQVTIPEQSVDCGVITYTFAGGIADEGDLVGVGVIAHFTHIPDEAARRTIDQIETVERRYCVAPRNRREQQWIALDGWRCRRW